MKKIECEELLAPYLDIVRKRDISDFEKIFANDLVVKINSTSLNYQQYRERLLFIFERYEIKKFEVVDLIFEKDIIAARIIYNIVNIETREENDDNTHFLMYFKNNEIQRIIFMTKMPIDYKPKETL